VTVRSFLTVDDLNLAELGRVLDLADELKANRRQRDDLAGASIGMIFEKPSTRTRVSFQVAITELGGAPLALSPAELQLGRGETIEDTARVLSRYLHALVVRTFEQSRLERLAAAGSIAVINALSDFAHPCQALADLQTIRAHKGPDLRGVTLAYLGDGNNVAHSLLRAGAMTGMRVVVATPPGFEPDVKAVDAARGWADQTGAEIVVTTDVEEAVRGADAVYTDVWASMGQEAEAEARSAAFRPYQVNGDVMALAADGAVALHCLPAHRGEEITAEVIDGDQSVVWEQAENRLHAQKALLLWLLGPGGDGGVTPPGHG
jgi:ornithine carbamoyltransferase